VRTHALVAAGAAVFTLAGAHGFPEVGRGQNVDPMRVAAQVASGIGFIGAGAIIQSRGSVKGVTTAAALWTSAALGLAAGAGVWWAAAAGAVLTLVILVALRPVGRHLIAPLTTELRSFDIRYERGHGTLGPVLEAIRGVDAQLEDIDIRDTDDGSTRNVVLAVRIPDPESLSEVARTVSDLPEVTSCNIRGAPSG
jgi:putative Mg2+ transporter-C (MgtC) family protein